MTKTKSRNSNKSTSNIARIAAELERQAGALSTSAATVHQTLAGLAGLAANTTQWLKAAAEVANLTTLAAATSMAAATAGSTLMVETLAASNPKQRTRLCSAVSMLAEALDEAGTILTTALSLPWPGRTTPSVAIH